MEGDQELLEKSIPAAAFIEDVEAFMKNEESAEAALKRTQANYSNYKMLEMKLQQNKMTLKTKLPDIEKALEMVKYLASKKDSEVSTHFEVNEGLFARSTLTDVNTACLWLGANVMVEYTFEEAIALLTKNVDNCRANLRTIEKDLDFIKDQITTTEVNIARIFNFDVKQRRAARGM
ncbi:von HippelLindau binding protein 1, putative [Acanthamoeba castellanii str. Neff]|uniref:Prefoldin subunit 3 n=1 Tax=Acanthamoeba castellanii (strain ATCC 30010 / Neff) TaxID=1257118 RepID=L8H2E2_ACACF|nr:von HippelLindau binding protein 1, putative [Acanthamoeba castellanii str. Neff]ELR19644.1 von HippelLindau binding protein 1, putative [Acanthamoeba castellanii str. Neff]